MNISPDHNTARLVGSLAFLNEGVGRARVRIYDGTFAVPGEAVTTQVLLTTILLDDPPGAIVGGELVLAASAVGLIVATGTPVSARFANGDDAWVGDATASAVGGAGEVQVEVSVGGTLLLGGGCALVSARFT